MTTAKQTPAQTKGKPATNTGSVEIKEALIPIARLEALIAMGRAFPPVVTLLSSCLLVTTGASGWLVYRDQHRAPVYFATDSAGRAVEMKPLTEPTMSRDQVSQYVVNALTDVMSMDYANYKDTQFKASVSFSQDAFAALVKNFEDQGIYTTMTQRKLVLRAIATGAPRVVREGAPSPGQPFMWVVQVPMAWTFYSAQRDQTIDYMVQAVVTRASTLEHSNGIAITATTVSRGVERP